MPPPRAMAYNVCIMAAADGHLEEATASLLATTYGMRGIDIAACVKADPSLAKPLVLGRPEIAAQVVWGVERELAGNTRW